MPDAGPLPNLSPIPAPDRPAPRWASVEQGAEYVGGGINPRTIRSWISDGLIPGYKFGARFVRVDLNDLDALARRIPAAGEWDGGRA